MKEKIELALKAALRGGHRQRVDTLRLIVSEIKNAEIAAKDTLSDDKIVQLLGRQAKIRRQSIEQYRSSGRDNLVDSEEAELAIIEEFMPPKIDTKQIEKQIEAAFASIKPSTPADMGKVMGYLKSNLDEAVDMSLVADLVRKKLS